MAGGRIDIWCKIGVTFLSAEEVDSTKGVGGDQDWGVAWDKVEAPKEST